MDIKVLGNRVLIRRDDVIEETEGGIKIPKVAKKLPQSGTVLRVGPGDRLPNGKVKEPLVEEGEHVLFMDSDYEPVMLDEGQVGTFIDGNHVFGVKRKIGQTFKYNETELIFEYEALRDVVYIWPSLPPKSIGSILLPDAIQREHHKQIGLVIAAGPGYLGKDGKYHPTDPRLRAGAIVKFDLSVPWGTEAVDVEGEKNYICMCGASDVHGLIDYLDGWE